MPPEPAPGEPAPPRAWRRCPNRRRRRPRPARTSADESGVLTVWVPYDAKVTVNGLETRSTGSRRQFVSYGLKPGFSYKYEVQAEVVRNGQVQEDTRTVVADGRPDHGRGLRLQRHGRSKWRRLSKSTVPAGQPPEGTCRP